MTRPGPLTPIILPNLNTTSRSNSPIFFTKNQYVNGSVSKRNKYERKVKTTEVKTRTDEV